MMVPFFFEVAYFIASGFLGCTDRTRPYIDRRQDLRLQCPSPSFCSIFVRSLVVHGLSAVGFT